MSIRAMLPDEFHTKLNAKVWNAILDMFYKSQADRPRGRSLEFYGRWRECYKFHPVVVESITSEVSENAKLQSIIDNHPLLSEGKKNFLRSSKHREQYLGFALAIHYQAWITKDKLDELYQAYIAEPDSNMRIQQLKKHLECEQHISAQLRVENAQLRAQIAILTTRNGLLEHRPPISIQKTVIRRVQSSSKRKTPD